MKPSIASGIDVCVVEFAYVVKYSPGIYYVVNKQVFRRHNFFCDVAVGSIAEAQKAAINAAAAAALSESKQDSLLTAHKLGNIENKTQKNIIVFLLIDALVIVSICGHSYIYSQYKPAEKTADVS